jgi:putative ABC transport system permease protein
MSMVYDLPPLLAGSLADLRDDSVVVGEDWGRKVGETAHVWLGDGEQTTLRVVGVISGQAETSAYVTPTHAFGAMPSVAYVKLRPGFDADTTMTALRQATAGHHARAVTREDWSAGESGRQGAASRLGLFVVLGILLAFLAVTIVNTGLISASQRTAEQATLRLVGATTRQIRRYVVGESLLVVTVGVVLAAATTAVSLAGLWSALARVAGPIPVDLPWQSLAAVVAGCAVLSVLAALLATRSPRSALAVADDGRG